MNVMGLGGNNAGWQVPPSFHLWKFECKRIHRCSTGADCSSLPQRLDQPRIRQELQRSTFNNIMLKFSPGLLLNQICHQSNMYGISWAHV
ncbi:hypothetical protein Zmor_024091 [Zophobas morio]|uniref:Uncharacterized protein n=1 Tax=Zophobas morio TaxID=2755281 RepID=A0AA38M7Q5_9CUCU|nr:hypothetical protein Zmor_024091 [Zophobas morio]